MKAVQVTRHGRPVEVVRVEEVAAPQVGPGEALIAARAASLNYGDIARTRGGVATVMLKPPFTLGMDVCGVVEAAAPGGEAFLGRRVVAMTKMALGGLAQQVIAPLTSVFPAPPELDDAQAAAFLLPFHVGYLALQVRARVQPGEFVLVTGAASGVGSAVVQLAAALGAQVIAVAGGAEKGDYCRSRGATHVIDYQKEQLFERSMQITADRGVDVAVDLVGGALTEVLWSVMAVGGRYLPVGFNGDPQGGLTGRPLRKISMGNFSVLGVMLAYGPAVPQMRRMGMNFYPLATAAEVHGALLKLIAAGTIRPSIGRRIGMDEVAAALEDHEARRTRGRTVVEIVAP